MLEKFDKDIIRYLDKIKLDSNSELSQCSTVYEEDHITITRGTPYMEAFGQKWYDQMKEYQKDFKKLFNIDAKLTEHLVYRDSGKYYIIVLEVEFK